MNQESQPIIPEDAANASPTPANEFERQLGTPTSVRLEQLDDFSKQLGIQYPVSYYVRNLRGTAEILTDISGKRHMILMSPLVNANPQGYIPDITHELCHAKFSEQLDPIFSTVRFPRKYGQLSEQEYAEFAKNAQLVELCQSYVDIWINDLRFEIDPDLTLEENDSVLENAKSAVEFGDPSIVTDPRKAISIAMVLAEQRRHKLKMPNVVSIMKMYGKEWQKIIKLRDMMATLPRFTDGKGNFLPDIKDIALKSFEENAQKVSDILGYPIKPYLIDESLTEGGEEKIKVWDFEEKK